jgi:hypothetical protein
MQNKFSPVLSKTAVLLASALLSFQLQPAQAAMRPNESYIAYTLSNDFATPTLWTVNGGPTTLQGASPFISDSIVLHTDGAGKITGTGWFWVDYVTGPSAPYTAFFVDVTGKIASSPSQPTPMVTLLLKGSGYSLDGNGGATLNKLNAKFVGPPGPDPDATNGSMVIVGKLTGKITGTTPLGDNSASLNLDMIIPDSTSTPLSLSSVVLQSAKRMLLYNFDFAGSGGTNPDFDLDGSGTINTTKNTYKYSVKGRGPEKGWSLLVTGTLGTYNSQVRTNVTFLAPVSAAAKGKIQGQAVSAQTTNLTAEIITGTLDDFLPH